MVARPCQTACVVTIAAVDREAAGFAPDLTSIFQVPTMKSKSWLPSERASIGLLAAVVEAVAAAALTREGAPPIEQ
jgi:hypothetical protein